MISVSITTSDDITYTADLDTDTNTVTICRIDQGERIWAGDGTWDSGITECAANIGDEAYALLDAAIVDSIQAGGEKKVTKITTARSRMYSDVAICRVDAAGHRDGFEDLRVTHAADATDDEINADINAAVAAA